MLEIAENKSVLRKRLVRMLECEPSIRREEFASNISPKLSSIGRPLLIGGAVRDVAREGARKFESDLDFVICYSDLSKFYDLMDEWGGVRNRFGGYGLSFKHWRVDVWALEDTWARTAGLRHVAEPKDLLACTFFDWDAVLFDLATKEIISSPNYFERIKAGILDLNLEDNPNPKGALVRALRRGALWRVAFGERLSDYVEQGLSEYLWQELLELEESAFTRPVLHACDRSEVQNCLRNRYRVDGAYVSMPFAPHAEQLALPL